jgi:hypothetical protein
MVWSTRRRWNGKSYTGGLLVRIRQPADFTFYPFALVFPAADWVPVSPAGGADSSPVEPAPSRSPAVRLVKYGSNGRVWNDGTILSEDRWNGVIIGNKGEQEVTINVRSQADVS